MPGPHWLNSWVKVNSRHVAYAGGPQASRGNKESTATAGAAPAAPAAASAPAERSPRVRRHGGSTAVAPNTDSRLNGEMKEHAGKLPNSRSDRSGGSTGYRSTDSSASVSKRDEPMFGVSTALLNDSSSALSLPIERAGSTANHGAESSPRREQQSSHAALQQQHPPAVRRRSAKKSASYDANRAHPNHPPSTSSRSSSQTALDLTSAQDLLAEFFAASPFVDDPSVATFPRRGMPSSGLTRSRRGTSAEGEHFSTGRYLNEAAFVQQLEQRRRADILRRKEATTSPAEPIAPSRPAVSRAVPETPLPVRSRHLRHQHHSSSSIKSDASPAAASAPAAFGGALKLFPPSFFPGDKPCEACKGLEDKLEAALDDIEYLRTAALQQEVAMLSSAKPDSTMNPSNQSSSWASSATGGLNNLGTARVSLSEASKQVAEATNRHRKQVEQLMKERLRWQQDIHFKLHKFANLCKDLNEESVVRNETALTLQQELNELKDERDALAEDATRLRERVAQLERYELECERMRKLLYQREADEMIKAEDALQSRDQTIRDLSGKLESALEELEMERAQRQRRQIIFPVNDITFNGPSKR